jgi:predicted ArsR family transcriptional regulator
MTAKDRRAGRLTAAILALLDRQPGLTCAALAHVLEKDSQAVWLTLVRLVAQGRIRREGKAQGRFAGVRYYRAEPRI